MYRLQYKEAEWNVVHKKLAQLVVVSTQYSDLEQGMKTKYLSNCEFFITILFP